MEGNEIEGSVYGCGRGRRSKGGRGASDKLTRQRYYGRRRWAQRNDWPGRSGKWWEESTLLSRRLRFRSVHRKHEIGFSSDRRRGCSGPEARCEYDRSDSHQGDRECDLKRGSAGRIILAFFHISFPSSTTGSFFPEEHVGFSCQRAFCAGARGNVKILFQIIKTIF